MKVSVLKAKLVASVPFIVACQKMILNTPVVERLSRHLLRRLAMAWRLLRNRRPASSEWKDLKL